MAWDAESLYLHMEALIGQVLARMEAGFEAQKEATDLAASTLEARLEHLNQFKQAMSEQAGRFVTRREMWAYLAGLIMTIVAVITLVLSFASL